MAGPVVGTNMSGHSDLTAAPASATDHWEAAWADPPTAKSWYQPRPEVSLRLLADHAPGSVVDVGGGASTLVDGLLDDGRTDLTVLDISPRALAAARERLGARADAVTWQVADLRSWEPTRTFDAWHDRAVFHFLVNPEERAAYRWALARALRPGGVAVVATFADDGPDRCSGLPTTRWDAADLAVALGDDLDLLHTEREHHRTPAGGDQAFRYVVLRRRA